jgi:hypothetical protein
VDEEKFVASIHRWYLNMGKAHEDVDHLEDAKHFYKQAEGTLDVLSDDRYGKLVRDAVQREDWSA